MTKFQEALLSYGHLTVRTYDNEEWTTKRYVGNSLKEFINKIDGQYDETMYKMRGAGLMDLYLN